ncbi:MAG: FG-GAP-like repeat-containing protein, partial [Pyrinomonadaceae bacterium]
MKKITKSKYIFAILGLCAIALMTSGAVWAAVTPTLVSRAPNGDNGNALSKTDSVSADGRYVVFESNATNLVNGVTDANGFTDIFIRDTQTNVVRYVSLADATHAGNNVSFDPKISANGKYVVFTSESTNLTPLSDTNGAMDIFRFDVQTNQVQLISVNFAGTAAGNGMSGMTLGGWRPFDLSDDGRYVAFMSNASDLTNLNDANNNSDIFERDAQGGFTRMISINRFGTGTGNNASLDPSVSADGQLISFTSGASDLIAVDGNGNFDVFVYNVQTQVTLCASLSPLPGRSTGNTSSFAAAISKNGTRVAFFSQAYDLTNIHIPTDNPYMNVFVYDLGLRQNTLVSVGMTGSESAENNCGNGPNPQQLFVSISANGRYVVFESRARNLTPNTDSSVNVFRRDLSLAKTDLVSIDSNNSQSGSANSALGVRDASMSADGRFVAFHSASTNLVSDVPGNSMNQVYVREMLNGITTVLSANYLGAALGNGDSTSASISANGRQVVFNSGATNLTPINTFATNNIYRSANPIGHGTISDFDGDGLSDFALYRPGQGAWYVLNNPGTFASYRFYGNATDIIVPADYNGDGRTDYAVFRPSNGTWYINDSLSFGESLVQFGQAGDVPVPQDYDADGKADLAVFRNGIFYWLGSQTGQFNIVQFGLAGDLPVTGDFDGDSKPDFAVFRPVDGNWHIRRSSNGALRTVHFGQNGDKPIPADYDGDGRTDLAVYRNGAWWILNSLFGNVTNAQWGLTTDVPVP